MKLNSNQENVFDNDMRDKAEKVEKVKSLLLFGCEWQNKDAMFYLLFM